MFPIKKQNLLFFITIAFFGVLLCGDKVSADTEVSGILNTNTTWTLSGSPYTIINTVQIPSGIVLTIEPGVEINANALDPGRQLFTVKGAIIANGTSDKLINFKSTERSLYFNFEAA